MDWLSEEFGSSIRCLGVDYVSNATYWENYCPHEVEQFTIQDQAKALADKLSACGLGNSVQSCFCRPQTNDSQILICLVGMSICFLFLKRKCVTVTKSYI